MSGVDIAAIFAGMATPEKDDEHAGDPEDGCARCRRGGLAGALLGAVLERVVDLERVVPFANRLFDLQRFLDAEADRMPRRAKDLANRMRDIAVVAFDTADIIVELARDEERKT